jgi:hypothetical protein
MSRPAALIELSEKERGELEGLSRRRRTAQGQAQRAQIVLLAADGLENKAIAHRTGVVENQSANGALWFLGMSPFGRSVHGFAQPCA